MRKRKVLRWVGGVAVVFFFASSFGVNLGLLFSRRNAGTQEKKEAPAAPASVADRKGDEELAYLLVKLELKTRGEIASHFGRAQSPVPGVDKLYQRLMIKNRILPAAVAGQIFAETVPNATGGRAWVKMVVDEPRNPNNRSDAAALNLLAKLREGAQTAESKTREAYYYAEPIVAKKACLYCHGGPEGAPDPYFSEFKKEGWREGEIIGAVVSRVAPEKPSAAVSADAR